MRAAVERLVADRRTTLVVVEHRVNVWVDLVDRIIVLGPEGTISGPPDQVLAEHRDQLLAAGVWVPDAELPLTGRGPQPETGALLWTEQLTTGYAPGNPVGVGLDITIAEGRSTVLTGPNGAGKSTLALTLAGLLRPLDGRVVVTESLRPAVGQRARRSRRTLDPADPHTWTSRDLLTRLGTVFQQPEHQFVERSVKEELAVGLRALDWSADRIKARVGELLDLLHLDRLADFNPFTLSGGEQRRLSVGTVLATSPAMIVLDEPTFGQDRNTWTDLVRLILDILDEGRTIVSVTHDPGFLEVLAEQRIHLAAR